MYFQRKTQVKRMQLHCNNIAGKIMISTTDHTMFIKGVFPTVHHYPLKRWKPVIKTEKKINDDETLPKHTQVFKEICLSSNTMEQPILIIRDITCSLYLYLCFQHRLRCWHISSVRKQVLAHSEVVISHDNEPKVTIRF